MPLLQKLKDTFKGKNPRGWFPVIVHKHGSCGGYRKVPAIVKMEILEQDQSAGKNRVHRAKVMKIVDLAGEQYTRAYPIDDAKQPYEVGQIYHGGFLYPNKEMAFGRHNFTRQQILKAGYTGALMVEQQLPNGRKVWRKKHYRNGRHSNLY